MRGFVKFEIKSLLQREHEFVWVTESVLESAKNIMKTTQLCLRDFVILIRTKHYL